MSNTVSKSATPAAPETECDKKDCTRCKIAAAFERIKSVVKTELVAQLHDAADFLDKHGGYATSGDDARQALLSHATELRKLDADAFVSSLLALASKTFDLLRTLYEFYGGTSDAIRATAELYNSPVFAHVLDDFFAADTRTADLVLAAAEQNTRLAKLLVPLAEHAHRAIVHRCHDLMEGIYAHRRIIAALLGSWHHRGCGTMRATHDICVALHGKYFGSSTVGTITEACAEIAQCLQSI